MTPKSRSVLAALLGRVAERSGQPDAVFSADETRWWPKCAITALTDARLIRGIPLADSITCLGCEERCRRQIMLWSPEVGGDERATWTCHLHVGYGPFDDTIDGLRRWGSNRQMVAKFIGRELGLPIRDHDASWRRIRFAALAMRGAIRAFSIEFDGRAYAKVGSASIPLIEMLDWEDSVTIDRAALEACFDASEDTLSGSKRTQLSTTVREDAKHNTVLRNRRVQRRLDALALKHPTFSKERLAQILVKSGMGEEMSSGRIARVTRMSKKPRRKRFA